MDSTSTRWLSAFDLDGTLIQGNISFAFGQYLYRHGHLPLTSMLKLVVAYGRHRYGGLSLGDLHQTAFSLFFRGRQRNELDGLVGQFLDVALPKLWYSPAVDQLIQAKESGHYVAILSSSPDFLVEAMAARLQVATWQSSVYPVSETGHLMTQPYILVGEAKALGLAQLATQCAVDRNHTVVYSDSILDLPFLLAGGRAVGVRPDRKLKQLCVKNAWDVL